MRTSIRTFVGAALALVALSACKKDFLEQDPSQLFTADQLKKASQWNDGINEGQYLLQEWAILQPSR